MEEFQQLAENVE